MNTLEVLKQAIKNRQSISFEYNKEGKVSGLRFGNPYAVFIYTSKNTRIQSTKVHIVQKDSVSDSKKENSFRMFNSNLNHIQIISYDYLLSCGEKMISNL